MLVEQIEGDIHVGNLLFVAIRKNEQREWLDSSTIALLPEIVQERIDAATVAIPSWAKENPVVRIAPVKVFEVIQKEAL